MARSSDRGLSAATIATALGGRKAGGAWMAPCVAHEDRVPSLSIQDGDDGKVLAYCHAGCEQAIVIAALHARGLWPERGIYPATATLHDATRNRTSLEKKRTEAALRIWQATTPTAGAAVEIYLRARGIIIPVPPTLRFSPGLKHPSGSIWPAMVGLVMRGTEALAIHRTFLARDGNGKARVDPQKMMLGPCRGSAVRLAEPGDMLMVGEGIETCLAAMQATGRPAWAALSASGLQALELPASVREVIILADVDDPGEKAARNCAQRWTREGRRVRIARPPRGRDFNDALLGIRDSEAMA